MSNRGRLTDLPTFNVHAFIAPSGDAQRSNTLYRKIFSTIYDTFNHEDVRWVVVSKTGETTFLVIDLWASRRITVFPYVEPVFLLTDPFKTVEQAIGAAVLSQ